jgi:hypothetical protein
MQFSMDAPRGKCKGRGELLQKSGTDVVAVGRVICRARTGFKSGGLASNRATRRMPDKPELTGRGLRRDGMPAVRVGGTE